MKRLFKGFIIGIGKIIPGVSGALLAISMGVYDKSIYYINNFKNNKKESIKYLLPLGIGVILSIILFSKIISYFLTKYYLMTMLFFIGLIIGTVTTVMKETNKKDYYLVIISLLIFLFISLISIKGDYLLKGNIIDIIVFFISGLFEAVGTVVPGISSTALLMTIGTYKIIISSIGNIFDINTFLANLKILIPYLLGIIIGLITVVKIIAYLFKKHHKKVYAVILGLLLSTIITMTIDTFRVKESILELLIGIILMFIGIFITNIFDK